MTETNDLLAAIEVIHSAGLDTELWPKALAATARLLGSNAATVESYDPRGHVLEWHGVGIPPAEQIDYFEYYAAINPRANFALQMPAAELLWDYQILDELAMDRDPYYSELLPRTDFRYFLSGRLMRTPHEVAFATVQRTRAQGHVTPADIKMMGRLVPHFRQARDVAMRLKRTTAANRSLEGGLDWLADGVALVARDGAVLYANEALQDIVRSKGIAIKRGALVFDSAVARARFAEALGAVARLREGDPDKAALHDFPVARSPNAPSYLVSLRPLTRAAGDMDAPESAIAIVFVRDTLRHDTAGARLLVEMFGLTPAEADLAGAIQAGIPLERYARERAVSLNTVYTHLRRLKEKTGCKRMSDLIRKFNELQVPLRLY
jgi:DNA-binding CsgD family transcriptional regulator